MADQTQDPIDSAQEVLSNLKARAKAAQEANDAFLFGILNDLIKVASPIVTRAFARQQREDRSKINAAHKALRAKFREDSAKNRSDLPHLTRE